MTLVATTEMQEMVKVLVNNDRTDLLGPEESLQFLNERTRAVVGVGAEQFLHDLDAGKYDDMPDDVDHAELLRLVMLVTGGR